MIAVVERLWARHLVRAMGRRLQSESCAHDGSGLACVPCFVAFALGGLPCG